MPTQGCEGDLLSLGEPSSTPVAWNPKKKTWRGAQGGRRRVHRIRTERTRRPCVSTGPPIRAGSRPRWSPPCSSSVATRCRCLRRRARGRPRRWVRPGRADASVRRRCAALRRHDLAAHRRAAVSSAARARGRWTLADAHADRDHAGRRRRQPARVGPPLRGRLFTRAARVHTEAMRARPCLLLLLGLHFGCPDDCEDQPSHCPFKRRISARSEIQRC